MSSLFTKFKETFITGTPEQIAARKAADERATRKVMGQNEQNTLGPRKFDFASENPTPATRKNRKARKARKSLRKRNLRK